MRTYALAAWLILCAGIQTTCGQQPTTQTRDPFLDPPYLEQVGGRLDGEYVDRAGRGNDLEQLRPEFRSPRLDPQTDALDSGEDAFSFQYPLDQGDYRPPVAPPEQNSRSWVPPVLRRDEQAHGPDGQWLRLKSTKAALSHVGSGGSLGITTIQLRPTIEFPNAPGMFLTPNVGWHFIAGPSTTDLPSLVYDVSVDVSMYRPIGDQWLVQVSLMPGIFTDGDNTGSDALRIQGKLMGFYTLESGNQFVVGIVYLDREDVPVLPTLGLIMQPREDLRYELLFPKPRLAWRQYVNADWEQWVYVTGELGGGSWAVRRTTGLDDIATYRDLRFVLGLERKCATGRSWYLEGGYVFGRELEFESDIGNTSFSETAFLRVGGAF